MFIIEYVYQPLWGNAYVTSDICDSLVSVEYSEKEMRLELTHSAYNLEQKRVNFNSFIVIPKQRVTVRNLSPEEMSPGTRK